MRLRVTIWILVGVSAVIAGAFGWHWISNGWPPQRADWVTEIGLLITVEALAIAVVAASSAALSVSKYTESVKLELSGMDQQSIMLHEQAGVALSELSARPRKSLIFTVTETVIPD